MPGERECPSIGGETPRGFDANILAGNHKCARRSSEGAGYAQRYIMPGECVSSSLRRQTPGCGKCDGLSGEGENAGIGRESDRAAKIYVLAGDDKRPARDRNAIGAAAIRLCVIQPGVEPAVDCALNGVLRRLICHRFPWVRSGLSGSRAERLTPAHAQPCPLTLRARDLAPPEPRQEPGSARLRFPPMMRREPRDLPRSRAAPRDGPPAR